jgi:hypothetical protein
MCQTHSRDAAVWRASLENPLTQEVLRFATLPDLFAFLRAETGHDHLGAGWDGTSPPASAL